VVTGRNSCIESCFYIPGLGAWHVLDSQGTALYVGHQILALHYPTASAGFPVDILGPSILGQDALSALLSAAIRTPPQVLLCITYSLLPASSVYHLFNIHMTFPPLDLSPSRSEPTPGGSYSRFLALLSLCLICLLYFQHSCDLPAGWLNICFRFAPAPGHQVYTLFAAFLYLLITRVPKGALILHTKSDYIMQVNGK
jgi:hypothetical protein